MTKKYTRPLTTSFAILCLTSTLALASVNTVEIHINETSTPNDDYITWGPTNCRIRISPLFSAADDLKVVLTNDVTKPLPGQTQPLDGDVAFDKSVGDGETAKKSSLELTLPRGGDWVPFVIAGSFPEGSFFGRSSSRDKDTVIEVHATNAAGPIIGRHQLMVRVRKNLLTLTDHEKYRLIDAIGKLHKRGMYEKFVEVHDWAARGDKRHIARINHPKYSYPDAAHRDSNFLPWHRIDLLQFERELQKIHPDVAIHYWKLDEGDPSGAVFSPDFYGSNEVDMENPPTLNTTPYLDFVRFSRDNPLHGWRITYQGRFANSELLTRWPIDRTRRPWLLGTTKILPGEADVLLESEFELFVDAFESETHNKSHHWIGPPMRDCTVAPADPFFWSFHSWFDRVWAKWQWKYDRFATDGNNDSYKPVGKFDPMAPTHPKGHYLEDTMWPWDGDVGEGQHSDPAIRYFQSRPPVAPIGHFPESPIVGTWPNCTVKPRVKDAIDCFGLDPKVMPHGTCYDDIPFGVATADAKKLLTAADEGHKQARATALAVFTDAMADIKERLTAADFLVSGIGLSEEDLNGLMVIMKGDADPELRSHALRVLSSSKKTRTEALEYALERLEEGDAPQRFQMETLRIVDSLTHFAPRDAVAPEKIHKALREAANPSRKEDVRSGAIKNLAAQGDVGAIDIVREAYQRSSLLTSSEAARVLAINAGGARMHNSLIRPNFDSPDETLTLTLSLVSGPDAVNVDRLKEIVATSGNRERIRIAALHLISSHDAFPDFAIEIIGSSSVPLEIKREAVALLRHSKISDNQRREIDQATSHVAPQLRTDINSLLQNAQEP